MIASRFGSHLRLGFVRAFALSGLLLLTACDRIPLLFFNGAFRSQNLIAPTLTLELESPNFSISDDPNPIIKVSGIPDGRAVRLFSDAACTTQVATGVVSSGSVNLTSSTLAAGLYQFKAQFAGETGIFGSCSASTVSYRVDGTPVTLSFTQRFQRVVEGAGLTNMTLNLSGAKAYDIVLTYNTKGTLAPSALIGNLPSGGTITIPAGQTTVNFPIVIGSDATATGERHVQVNIVGKNSSLVTSGTILQSRFSIRDTDTPVVSFSKISTGLDTSCGITSTGSLQCWGLNASSQLGDGATTNRFSPVKIDVGTQYSDISIGYENACGITSTGALNCWGNGFSGINGDGSTTSRITPAVTDSGTNYQKISLGFLNFVCGITSTGVLKCWGFNDAYQLGDGTLTNRLSPTVIDGGTNYSEVDAGHQHACGITTSGVLKCWGHNDTGQVGDGTTVDVTTPTVIDGGTNYASISVGNEHTCGITTGGVLKCWGSGGNGELGNVTGARETSPVVIDAGTQYSKVAAGSAFTCGITTAGVMKCWGSGRYTLYGQNGDGDIEQPRSPVAIDSGVTYSEVATGQSHTCAITTAGVLKCWGSNSYGQLGNGETSDYSTPTLALDDAVYTSISTLGSFGCGLTSRNGVRCWGSNTYGRLGDGTANSRSAPVDIDASTRYQSVVAGRSHSCGITVAGVLKCWGRNDWGQLADGTLVDSSSPVIVDSGTLYKSVSVGFSHTCAITSADVLKCWGYGGEGQLGNGSTTLSNTAPIVIDPGVSYKAISASEIVTCGITMAGLLKCWGLNFNGQLADGTTTDALSPVATSDAATVYEKLTVSLGHGCAITSTGVLKCWGVNFVGQLGDGSTTTRLSPVVVDTGVTYQAVSARGSDHTCGITTSGVLKCWGSNFNGQVGDGTLAVQTAPVVIDAGVAYSSIAAGVLHSCGVTTTGTAKCWGSKTNGRFGDGTMNFWPVEIVTGLN